MSSRVAGAALAVLAALALVSASAGMPWGWWDGHPQIAGRVITAKHVTVSLLSAKGCNTGGDAQCQPLELRGSFTTLSLVELGASGLLIAALVLLALTTLVRADSRRTLGKVVIGLAAVAVIVAGTLLVLGPQMKTSQEVALPIGPGLYLFGLAIAGAIAGSVLAMRALEPAVAGAPAAYGAPYPGFAPHAHGFPPGSTGAPLEAPGFLPGSPGFPAHATDQPPSPTGGPAHPGFPPQPTYPPSHASADHPPAAAPLANMTLPTTPPTWAGAASTGAPGGFDGKASFVRSPAMPAPPSPGGVLPGPQGPLGGGPPGPARPLHDHPGRPASHTATAPGTAPRPGTLPPPNRARSTSAAPPSPPRARPTSVAPPGAAATPMTLAGAVPPGAPMTGALAPGAPMTLAGAVAPGTPPRPGPPALARLGPPPPERPGTPPSTRSTIASAAVPPPPLADAEPTATSPFAMNDSLDEPEHTEAGDVPEPRDTAVQDIVAAGRAPAIHDRDSEAEIATIGHDRFDPAELEGDDGDDGDDGTQAGAPPIAPTATQAQARAPSGKVPIPVSTASPSLPPPVQHVVSTGSPSPACPQCEAPMAWVEEHLRFYCKSCRMYF